MTFHNIFDLMSENNNNNKNKNNIYVLWTRVARGQKTVSFWCIDSLDM